MADAGRRTTAQSNKTLRYLYEVNGSAALQPEYIPEEQPQRKRRRRVKPKAAPKFRNVELEATNVRPADPISPFGIAGVVMVIVLAAMILQCHIQLNSLNSQVVAVRAELAELQELQDQLDGQYEQLFDMQGIESDMLNSGKMIKVDDGQQVYLDMSEPDSAVSYTESSELLERLAGVVDAFFAFFQ